MLKRHPDALWAELGSQVAILNMVSGRYFEIQGVGSELWRWLEFPSSPKSLTEQLTLRYRVEADQAQEDVLHFLDQLRNAGLLEEIADPAV
jgi:hypothetical protein